MVNKLVEFGPVCKLFTLKSLVTCLILFFILLICIDMYGIAIYQISFARESIYLLTLLIALFLFHTRLSWFILMGFCIYRIYNLVKINSEAAEPTGMHFTATLEYVMMKNRVNSTLLRIVFTIPFYFYHTLIIMLILNPGRRFFGMTKQIATTQ